MDNIVEKWIPCAEISNGCYQMKCLLDSFDGLSVELKNESFDDDSLEIRWEGQVESYCCSEEGMRYKFVSGDWQNIRKIFPDWSFFVCKKIFIY